MPNAELFALKSFMTRILLGQLRMLPSQSVSQSVGEGHCHRHVRATKRTFKDRIERVRFAVLNAADGRTEK